MSDINSVSASVVVASFSNKDLLKKCLQSLETGAPKAEIIVSTCLPEHELSDLTKQFHARFIFSPEEYEHESVTLRETRVFRLRSKGVLAAKGEIIAMLEDHCVTPSGWLFNLMAKMGQGNEIVGGTIENSAAKGLDSYALYCAEYAQLMPPYPDTQPPYLSAANCAYHHAALKKCQPIWQHGFYDNEVIDALKKQGGKLYLSSAAGVNISLPFTFTTGLVHLYTGGKRYGSYRGSQYGNIKRLLRLPMTLLVPAVLYLRIINTTLKRKPKHLYKLIRSTPGLICFLTAWGAGEFAGTINAVKIRNSERSR